MVVDLSDVSVIRRSLDLVRMLTMKVAQLLQLVMEI